MMLQAAVQGSLRAGRRVRTGGSTVLMYMSSPQADIATRLEELQRSTHPNLPTTLREFQVECAPYSS